MIARTLVSLAALATAQTAAAQSTSIVPDVAPGLSLGTTVSHSGNVYTVDGGTTAGTNLFHSFNNFDLGAGDTAQWVYSGGNPASLTSVISRVTGGSPSSILGVIDSTAIPNADFYFINPAGIVFSGQDAQVNVPAAAHFSTASELRFADGAVFSVATTGGSTLSVASPAAFGFLGNEGDILLSSIEALEDPPFITQAGAVSFSAANIGLDNVYIGASEQSFTAVGSAPLTVGIDGTTDGPAQGRVEMVNSWLQTWAADCLELCLGAEGFVSVNAGELDLNLTGIVADFDSTSDEGGSSFLRLTGNNWVNILDSIILADGYGTAAAGDISIASFGDVNLVGSLVQAYTQGSGDAGTIAVLGANVLLSGTTIGSESYGSGHSGSVVISAANSLALESGAWVFTTGFDSGAAGSVSLSAPHVIIADSLVGSESYGSGNAGTVTIQAPQSLEVILSSLSSASYGDANAGSIAVTAGVVDLDGSTVTSASLGAGDAGTIVFDVESDFESRGSILSTEATLDGQAGDISISAADVLLQSSIVNSLASFGGDAGSIRIAADNSLVMVDSSMNTAAGVFSPDGDDGQAGQIDLSAGTMQLDSSLVLSAAQGGGGSIRLDASDISMSVAQINANTTGSGSAGTIEIHADTMSASQSEITSSSYSSGAGGSVLVDSDTLSLGETRIIAEAHGSGNAGDVSVLAGALAMDGFSAVSTNTFGSGNAGNVLVEAETIDLNGSSIASQSASGASGNAGSVQVIADNIHVSNAGFITTSTFGSGDAGDITIDARVVSLTTGGGIASRSFILATGDAGNLDLEADELILESGGFIDLSTLNSGDGGTVTIDADSLIMRGPSYIQTDSSGSGAAGSIMVHSSGVTISDGARVSSNSLFGAAGNITFGMTPGSLLILSGETQPGLIETSSGPGTGGIITIASPLAIISNGGTISALGESGGANVQIDANYFIASSDRPNVVQVDGTLTFSNAIYDVSSGTTTADLSMVDASGVLQGQCSTVRATGQLSQLNIRPSGPFGTVSLPAIRAVGTDGPSGAASGACQ